MQVWLLNLAFYIIYNIFLFVNENLKFSYAVAYYISS